MQTVILSVFCQWLWICPQHFVLHFLRHLVAWLYVEASCWQDEAKEEMMVDCDGPRVWGQTVKPTEAMWLGCWAISIQNKIIHKNKNMWCWSNWHALGRVRLISCHSEGEGCLPPPTEWDRVGIHLFLQNPSRYMTQQQRATNNFSQYKPQQASSICRFFTGFAPQIAICGQSSPLCQIRAMHHAHVSTRSGPSLGQIQPITNRNKLWPRLG